MNFSNCKTEFRPAIDDCETPGRGGEGEACLREALALRLEALPPEHFFTALARGALGEGLGVLRRYAEAEPLLQQSYQDLTASQGEDNPKTLLARRRLAELYRNWGRPQMALRFQ